mmetsp:Transcript_102502/g.313423  ORF Transcript_102502/g.313423 Transcript_102502/m.313423 type:complete len:205 (+) Transcript_102502:181-795(+)
MPHAERTMRHMTWSTGMDIAIQLPPCLVSMADFAKGAKSLNFNFTSGVSSKPNASGTLYCGGHLSDTKNSTMQRMCIGSEIASKQFFAHAIAIGRSECIKKHVCAKAKAWQKNNRRNWSTSTLFPWLAAPPRMAETVHANCFTKEVRYPHAMCKRFFNVFRKLPRTWFNCFWKPSKDTADMCIEAISCASADKYIKPSQATLRI